MINTRLVAEKVSKSLKGSKRTSRTISRKNSEESRLIRTLKRPSQDEITREQEDIADQLYLIGNIKGLKNPAVKETRSVSEMKGQYKVLESRTIDVAVPSGFRPHQR